MLIETKMVNTVNLFTFFSIGMLTLSEAKCQFSLIIRLQEVCSIEMWLMQLVQYLLGGIASNYLVNNLAKYSKFGWRKTLFSCALLLSRHAQHILNSPASEHMYRSGTCKSDELQLGSFTYVALVNIQLNWKIAVKRNVPLMIICIRLSKHPLLWFSLLTTTC